jgi:hypothetical protein
MRRRPAVDPWIDSMPPTRSQPSPRYVELQRLYRELHEQGELKLGLAPEETFPGFSLDPHLVRIKRLIDRTRAATVLDYGSGKGRQYDARPIRIPGAGDWGSVIDYWGVDEIACYDPCYAPLSALPEGRFDGVICTDVLEHCPEEDIAWILDEMFGFATRFLYANVACYPALHHLPTGENAHCTIRPGEWWRDLLVATAARHPGVLWEVWTQHIVESDSVRKVIERRIDG